MFRYVYVLVTKNFSAENANVPRLGFKG